MTRQNCARILYSKCQPRSLKGILYGTLVNNETTLKLTKSSSPVDSLEFYVLWTNSMELFMSFGEFPMRVRLCLPDSWMAGR